MRGILRSSVAFLIAGVAAVAAPAVVVFSAGTAMARGGGGGGRGGGGGGRGGGGGVGSGRGGGATPGGGAGGTTPGAGRNGTGTGVGNGGVPKKPSNKTQKQGINGRTPSDYLEAVMRDDSDAARPDFLFGQRDASLVRSGEDDRAAAQNAQREKASRDRRDGSESAAHPL